MDGIFRYTIDKSLQLYMEDNFQIFIHHQLAMDAGGIHYPTFIKLELTPEIAARLGLVENSISESQFYMLIGT